MPSAVLLVLAVHASVPVLADGKAIYLDDGRVEVVKADALFRKTAASVAALFEAVDLVSAGPERWRLPSDPVGPALNWCEKERFAEQPGGAMCTGFLIGANRMATSAHCIRAKDDDGYGQGIDCQHARFVFDYHVDAGGNVRTEVDASQVYECADVLGGETSRSGADWRVVLLKRKPDRDILGVHAGRVPVDTPLHVIGHPSGLPAKVATGGKLVSHSDDGYFITDLDTYRGNSGSPVFATIDERHVVAGLLSRGAEDFETDAGGSCERSRICDVESCGGEHATSADRLGDWAQVKVGR